MEGEAILTGTMEEAGAAVISKMDAAGKVRDIAYRN